MWFEALSVYRSLIKQATMKGLAPDGMRIGRRVSLCSTLPGHSHPSRKECASRPVSRTAVGLRVHGAETRGKSWTQVQLGGSVCSARCGRYRPTLLRTRGMLPSLPCAHLCWTELCCFLSEWNHPFITSYVRVNGSLFFPSPPPLNSDGAETRFAPCCSFCSFFLIIFL